MKTPKYLTALLLAVAAASASAAEIASGEGKVFDAPDYVVVRKKLAAGSEMKRHNHPGARCFIDHEQGARGFRIERRRETRIETGRRDAV